MQPQQQTPCLRRIISHIFMSHMYMQQLPAGSTPTSGASDDLNDVGSPRRTLKERTCNLHWLQQLEAIAQVLQQRVSSSVGHGRLLHTRPK